MKHHRKLLISLAIHTLIPSITTTNNGMPRPFYHQAGPLVRQIEDEFGLHRPKARKQMLKNLRTIITSYPSLPTDDLMGMVLSSQHPEIVGVALDAIEYSNGLPVFEGDSHWQKVLPVNSIIAFKNKQTGLPLWDQVGKNGTANLVANPGWQNTWQIYADRIIDNALNAIDAISKQSPQRLTEASKLLNAQDSHENTLLHEAAVHASPERVKKLKVYIDPDTPNNAGQTALSKAALHHKKDVAKILLDDPRVNPNILVRNAPLLCTLVEYGYREMVLLLLTHADTNPNCISRSEGKTPLALAAENGNEALVRALLDHPTIQPDFAIEPDYRPLQVAINNPYYSEYVIRQLLADGRVDLFAVDSSGRTPLQNAANKPEIAALIQAEITRRQAATPANGN